MIGLRMNLRYATLILVTAAIVASCSQKAAPGSDKGAKRTEVEAGEGERRPDEDQIAEDCVAFVRSTKVVPARATSTDCPGCAAGGPEVLSFRHMKTDEVSCAGDTCNVVATVAALFNPASGDTIAGGLTAWIPPEERSAYLRGQTPAGEQSFRVQITYKRRGEEWRAVEFDRAPAK